MKPARSKGIFRVLAALPLSSAAGRKMLNGVHRFLGDGYDWDIELVRRDADFLRLFQNVPALAAFDGMIVAFAETPEIRRKQCEATIPIVFIDYADSGRSQIRHRAFVEDDDKSIAVTAAQHLLSGGERASFGYVPAREPTDWSERRGRAFADRLKLSKLHAAVFSGDGKSREELVSWLKELPKPAAVLAAYDDRAVDVLEACRNAGLSVPGDVAVLGIGNDEPICEASTPPLSSVAVNFEAQGYRAARELQALMLGGTNPKADIRYGARDVVRRASTTGSVPAATLVRRAIEFISENALRGISSRDVALHLHVSRRLADLRFREIRQESILTAIQRVRLNEVKRLLCETDRNLDEIAELCGYRSADVLRVLFKRQTGLSPRAWAAQQTVTRWT